MIIGSVTQLKQMHLMQFLSWYVSLVLRPLLQMIIHVALSNFASLNLCHSIHLYETLEHFLYFTNPRGSVHLWLFIFL